MRGRTISIVAMLLACLWIDLHDHGLKARRSYRLGYRVPGP